MNYWKKNMDNANQEDGLYIPNRQLSMFVSGLLLSLFLTFVVGYFLGKKHATQEFSDQMHRNSLADQVYASVVSLRDAQTTTAAAERAEQKGVEPTVLSDAPVAKLAQVENTPADTTITTDLSKERYYAQLIGFGTKRAADKFVQKLAQKNVATKTNKRVSKTAKGKRIAWYQVVTKEFNDKNELQLVVNKLVKEERLKDPRIVVC